MRKHFLSIALAAAALVPSAASAQSWGAQNTNICGGNNFLFCFQFSTATSGSNTVLTIINTGSTPAAPGLVFTAIGFNIFPTGVALGTSGANTNMVLKSDIESLSGAGGPEGIWGGAERAKQGGVTNGVNLGGIAANEWVSFTFATGSVDWSNSAIGIHAQSGPDACQGSSKMFVTANGTVTDGNLSDACGGGGGGNNNDVPEPAGVTLIAAGLVGLLGAAVRRRRA